MTQHITQEQAVDLATRKIRAESGPEYVHELCNAAIQHYLDQHKAELPVLPDPYGIGAYPYPDTFTRAQTFTYGQQRAAQARELALSEAIEAAIDVCGFNGVSAQTESHIRQAIEALKGK